MRFLMTKAMEYEFPMKFFQQASNLFILHLVSKMNFLAIMAKIL